MKPSTQHPTQRAEIVDLEQSRRTRDRARRAHDLRFTRAIARNFFNLLEHHARLPYPELADLLKRIGARGRRVIADTRELQALLLATPDDPPTARALVVQIPLPLESASSSSSQKPDCRRARRARP